nr:hypothetical protein [Luteibacter rhizovicinus]
MPKITRIAYNSSGWQRPTGDARREEAPGTYNSDYGFGHEDWLFRSEWQIDGWRYAFLQGVNKSRQKLVRERSAFDVTLFTIEPDKRRRYVADIFGVECMDARQASEAVQAFKDLGWYDTMRREVKSIDGNEAMLGNSPQASDILNVRFRVDQVVPFPPDTYADADDPITRIPRYVLSDKITIFRRREKKTDAHLKGRDEADAFQTYLRKAVAPTLCTPEHRRMQAILLEQLRKDAPGARIVCEEDFVDVTMETDDCVTLFEIKTDLEPRYAIRQALGQLLEYGYRQERTDKSLQLVIVGRAEATADDQSYLDRLRDKFNLQVIYRFLSLELR